MVQDASEIRAQIAETRLRLGETVEALTYKANIRARFDDIVTEKRSAVRDARDTIVELVADAAHFTKR